MATGNTRVKVDRQNLINKLKTRKQELESQYEINLKEYDKNIEPLKKKTLKAIDDYRKTVENDFSKALEEIGCYRNSCTAHIHFDAETVERPQKPGFDQLDRMINVLELSTELTINIGVNDQYYRYI